jgi:multisubunit Na+/H+ antiporter MnhC subunit
VAFIMMVYGMLTALVVGFAVRIYELVTRTSPGRSAKTTSLTEDDEMRRAA